MTQLSRERLENLLQYNDESSSSANAEMWEVKEMARSLLAAEAQEPVILYRERNPYNGITTGWQELTQQEFDFIKDNASENAEFRTLYAAPQPVAVPDEMTREEYKRRFMEEDDFDNTFRGGWNACRAAMLNAEPVSQPYTLPQWIPCSERMPEESGRYWCYVEEQNSLGKSHYQWNCSWNGDVWSDKALTGRVTHWMPLPTAPQELTK